MVLARRLIAGINGSGSFGFIKSAVWIIGQHGVAVLSADAIYFRNEKRLVIVAGKSSRFVFLKAMNYQEGATAIERNGQVGGHNA